MTVNDETTSVSLHVEVMNYGAWVDMPGLTESEEDADKFERGYAKLVELVNGILYVRAVRKTVTVTTSVEVLKSNEEVRDG